MRAKELRIGNIINFDGEHKITNTRIIAYINNSERLKNADSIAFEPIPLTEEWLLNFGFEKAKHSHGYNCYIKDGFDFDIVSHGRYWVLAIYTDESCTNSLYFAHNRFEYVHQFQNLYVALTGEELILNEKL